MQRVDAIARQPCLLEAQLDARVADEQPAQQRAIEMDDRAERVGMEGERDAALAGVEQRTHLSEELERAVHPAATLPCNNIQPLRKPAAPLRTHAHARTHARTQAETPGRCCRCGRACVRRTRTSHHRPPSSRRPCRSRPGTALRVHLVHGAWRAAHLRWHAHGSGQQREAAQAQASVQSREGAGGCRWWQRLAR